MKNAMEYSEGNPKSLEVLVEVHFATKNESVEGYL